jgi:hypothetical protein
MAEEVRKMYLDDVFRFGKHVGKTLNTVWTIDPGYVSWCRTKGIFDGQNMNKPAPEPIKDYWEDCPELKPRECPF